MFYCYDNAPRQLPTAHAVEAGEAGPSGVSQIPRWESDATSHSTSVNPVTVSHDRTRPLSKKLGHCLETNAESQLEDVDTAKSSPMVRKLNTRNLPVHIRSYRKVHILHFVKE